MAGKEILFHDSARERIVTGANMLADAVKVTLGPRGRTVVIDRSFGAPSIINLDCAIAEPPRSEAGAPAEAGF